MITDLTFQQQITDEVLKALEGGPPVMVATVVRAPEAAPVMIGQKLLVRSDGSTLGSLDGGPIEAAVIEDAQTARTALPRRSVRTYYYRTDGWRTERRSEAPAEAIEIMIEVMEAPAWLLVVGAGHIGAALAKMGAMCGFAVAVVDDRPDYANQERIPEADKILCGDFVEMLRSFPIESNTYIVCVTRGHKQDELSLRAVVTSPAAYVGMIGSRRRTSTVLRHLYEEGFPKEALERVHTPIGLDIGAETPEEIAVSILAEIIMVRRGGTGRPMREIEPPRFG